MSKKQDELLNSNYDGIQEYDNDLPVWWKGIFYVTILFAVLYAPYYMFHYGMTSEERLAKELSDIKALAPKVAPQSEVKAEELIALTKDATHLASGKEVFVAKCMPCHGPEGQGIVGPNLTDDFWIHGGKITDSYRTVNVGVVDKGMLAWKGLLPDDQIRDVVAYIYTLRGTHPANPKEAQGDKYTESE